MKTNVQTRAPKILILATLSGGYRGADAAGQSQLEYAPDTYILPVMSAAMFPESFYLRAFERGVDGIIVMYSGTDSPYKGAPEKTAEIINRTYERMKERGLDTQRLRLAAICTVCVRPFLKEIRQMNEVLDEIGLVPSRVPPAREAQAEPG
ncbi:MAG: hydrogenase iron-sulfur subunit [Ardenticatenia bacterium]|nr:hydrogenase iron-sulfur subunit [Ardenticatenia bacterium]